MGRGFRIFMGILSYVERKKINEYFMFDCSRGAYQMFLLKKVVGALIGVGVLKRMNIECGTPGGV